MLGHVNFPALGAGALALCSYWLMVMFTFAVIGHCNAFDFDFTAHT